MKKNQLELLAPAGSYDIFRAVLNAGADAVYVGGGQFGARAYANNFSEEELLRAIDEAYTWKTTLSYRKYAVERRRVRSAVI